jgi:hypothetical protein
MLVICQEKNEALQTNENREAGGQSEISLAQLFHLTLISAYGTLTRQKASTILKNKAKHLLHG